ncbi:MAG: STAS/SEC14 domain-containing protein [Gammaproteobacteria bacterium]|nr:STAS/SEC14 domain-containing protein [Gammaproteobacteria bacterium]
MDLLRHGLSVGIERSDNNYYLYIKAIGKLTHEDYGIIVPMIEGALEGIKDPNIIALIDGSEFEGWEIRAAWDDFKLSLKHGSEFKKVAVIGNKKWLQVGSKIGSWLISGRVRQFEDNNTALQWLLDK